MPEAEQARGNNANTIAKEQPVKAEKRNAFTELLSSRNKKPQHATESSLRSHAPKGSTSNFRACEGLGAYIAKPESYPSDIVIYHNQEFVAIHDMFPKSSLHLLLLPRDETKTRLHPFDAFEDADFLAKTKTEVQKLRTLAAGELRRKFGKESVQEQARQAALSADSPPDELPHGRDWDKEIVCGVHAVPSMSHLHVHVMSVDRYSERLKHRKHYNSFATKFFIPIEDFPLAKDDVRRNPGKEGYLKQDFVCWRCGKGFGNKFVELKAHLEQEYNDWKKL
ncbi:Aprataxin-like protein [Penicillium taxi]|uniref:Aprataxin-like protein n=1 Tax=Penicillium taxi TaxID=168475 RepID=UPI00254508C1|nr:Aprataxin-like protein [Penicillium taxi]KAJ5894060.1 Aprataxin-like protein [Penicillium taxi]